MNFSDMICHLRQYCWWIYHPVLLKMIRTSIWFYKVRTGWLQTLVFTMFTRTLISISQIFSSERLKPPSVFDNHHKEYSHLLFERKSRWPVWPKLIWVEVSVEVTLGSECLSYHINVTQKCWEWTEKLLFFWLVEIIYIYIAAHRLRRFKKCSHGGEKG